MRKQNNSHIFLPQKVKEALMEQFEVTGPTVYNAFFYKSDSKLATRIRKAALAQFADEITVVETYYRPMTEIDCYTPKLLLCGQD